MTELSMMHKPLLGVEMENGQMRRWTLTARLLFKTDSSFTLVIRTSGDETEFTKQIWCDGDMTPAVTAAEFEERVLELRTHEDMSDAAARDWLRQRVTVVSGVRLEIFEELQRYWGALSMLVVPQTTF